jgi:hypothetical protein
MTAKEVIDSLPVDGWVVASGGLIRRHLTPDGWLCPLEVFTGDSDYFDGTAKQMGVATRSIDAIMSSADGTETPLRRYMLRRWGLLLKRG